MSSSYSDRPLPPDVPLTPEVRAYLEASDEVNDIEPGLKSKMKRIGAQRFVKEADEIKKMLMTGKLKNLETFNFATAELSQKEKEQLETFLGLKNQSESPAPLESILGLNEFDMSQLRHMKDIQLENGKTLFGVEQALIYLFTDDHYLLMNGTLDQDITSLNMWREERFDDASTEKGFGVLQHAQQYVPELAKGLASALNKLPSSECSLYRGDAMKESDLKQWRQGKYLLTTKFFSCTTNVGIGDLFARKSAREYIRDTKQPYIPVLYVFQSYASKDIQEYSFSGHEKERTYPPGQLFKSIEVDEKTVPGLAIIYLVEIT